MRSQLKPILAALALALTGSATALAQGTAATSSGDEARFKAPSTSSAQPGPAPAPISGAASRSSSPGTADQTEPSSPPKMSGDDSTAATPAPDGRAPGVTGGSLSGAASTPGAVSASPMDSKSNGTQDNNNQRRSGRSPTGVVGNGTPLGYQQGGANALGNTGGLSTGPAGPAGEVAGGGGVRSGRTVTAPGSMNGSMKDPTDVDHGTHSTTTSGGDQGMGTAGTAGR